MEMPDRERDDIFLKEEMKMARIEEAMKKKDHEAGEDNYGYSGEEGLIGRRWPRSAGYLRENCGFRERNGLKKRRGAGPGEG